MESTITFGEMKLFDQDKINNIITESMRAWELLHQQEINVLKAESLEDKSSQEFICAQYKDLKLNFTNLQKINKQQAEDIKTLQLQSTKLEVGEAKDEKKLDAIEQYGRRQNLEIIGVPYNSGENTNNIIKEVAKMIDVDLSDERISTSHRLPASTRFMQGKRVNENQQPSSPPIIVRFVCRDIRNKLYSNRRLLRQADLKNFSIDGTTTIFVIEKLTRFRKNLLWKTKQKAKENGFKYTWTTNGNVFVRRSEIHNSIMIKNEQDLNLIKSH